MKPRIAVSTQHSREGLLRYLKVQRNYADSLDAAGAVPLFLPQLPGTLEAAAAAESSAPLAERAAEYLEGMAGLLLTGGQDIDPLTYGEEPHVKLGVTDPERDRWEIALYRAARERGLPVLGICRGIQLMAVAEGGSLYQDIGAQTGSSIAHFPAELQMERLHHRISIEADSLLYRICGTRHLTVNSIHHQAVREPGRRLRISAVSLSDGIVEALEDPHAPFVLGIQYHGEALGALDPEYLSLFRAFVAAAQRGGASFPS